MVYFGLLLIAIAFLIVAIYLAFVMTKSSRFLLTVTHTVKDVEAELDESLEQLYGILHETEQLATDVQVKLAATTPMFETIENVGRSSRYLSEEVNKRTKQFEEDGSLPGTEPFIQAIHYGEFGSKVIDSWKRGKKSAQKTY